LNTLARNLYQRLVLTGNNNTIAKDVAKCIMNGNTLEQSIREVSHEHSSFSTDNPVWMEAIQIISIYFPSIEEVIA